VKSIVTFVAFVALVALVSLVAFVSAAYAHNQLYLEISIVMLRFVLEPGHLVQYCLKGVRTRHVAKTHALWYSAFQTA
jgi:hypothetical protein